MSTRIGTIVAMIGIAAVPFTVNAAISTPRGLIQNGVIADCATQPVDDAVSELFASHFNLPLGGVSTDTYAVDRSNPAAVRLCDAFVRVTGSPLFYGSVTVRVYGDEDGSPSVSFSSLFYKPLTWSDAQYGNFLIRHPVSGQ